jgi:hypothetical protein
VHSLGYVCSGPSIQYQTLKCDPITIDTILWPDDHENPAGLLHDKAEMLCRARMRRRSDHPARTYGTSPGRSPQGYLPSVSSFFFPSWFIFLTIGLWLLWPVV